MQPVEQSNAGAERVLDRCRHPVLGEQRRDARRVDQHVDVTLVVATS
jgi:hypothetical protein